MRRQKISYYGSIALIALELPLIGFVSHAAREIIPFDVGQYLALDILYCLPVIQAARLAAIRATGGLRSAAPAILGVVTALACSLTELSIGWPDFPAEAFVLNTYSRAIVFTVISSVLARLWRSQKSVRRLKTLEGGASEGIAIMVNGAVRDLNAQLVHILGYDRDELIGRPIAGFAAAGQWGPAPAASPGSRVEHEMVRKDGAHVIVEVRAQEIPYGDHTATLLSIRDITERKKYESELVAAKAEADRANAEKTRFLAAASHDLRQPLTALALYTEVLKDRLDSENLTIVTKMGECVAGLSDLLAKLLDLSKLDAGVEVPYARDFALDDMLDALLATHAPEAELKALRLRRRRSGLTAHTDPVLFQRIVGNLLANAIRYTDRGGVLIGCRHRRGKTWLEVWDTGIGIPPDKTSEIFDAFKQLNNDGRTHGSGLGLAIVAGTAALLELQIRVESRPGRGSLFAIELPLGTQASAAEAAAPAGTMAGLRVALVDDNAMTLNALTCAMENAGHHVVAAANGPSLLEQLGTAAPDVLICDYRLAGGQTGYDVIASARRTFGEALPAIIITGDTDPELMRSMAGKGIDMHYKPVVLHDLQANMERLVQARTPVAAGAGARMEAV